MSVCPYCIIHFLPPYCQFYLALFDAFQIKMKIGGGSIVVYTNFTGLSTSYDKLLIIHNFVVGLSLPKYTLLKLICQLFMALLPVL